MIKKGWIPIILNPFNITLTTSLQTELLRKAVEEGEDPCAAPLPGVEEEEEEE